MYSVKYMKNIMRKNFNWDKKISELEKKRNKLSDKLINLKSSGKNTMGQLELVEMELKTLSELRKYLQFVNDERRTI
jgi:hypothetical protein